jgi:hypothetical protein
MLVHRGLVLRLRSTPAQSETLRQWITPPDGNGVRLINTMPGDRL